MAFDFRPLAIATAGFTAFVNLYSPQALLPELSRDFGVGAGLDAADDWIAARADARTIVITSDVPLASRCVKAGAQVIAPNGRPFTDASIGMASAMRNLMTDLREAGQMSGGPAAFSPRDRSAFLGELDRTIRRLVRRSPDQNPGAA